MRVKDYFRSRLLRDPFIAGLRSTKPTTALITECEEKTFEDLVQRAKRLEQISADVEVITEHSGEKIYLNNLHKICVSVPFLILK